MNRADEPLAWFITVTGRRNLQIGCTMSQARTAPQLELERR